MRIGPICLGIFNFFMSASALITPRPPSVFINQGACPFECCTYQKWNPRKNITAYEKPDLNAKVLGIFKKGSTVVGLTGVVQAHANPFVVEKQTKSINRKHTYLPGDTLWAYDYLGEGSFNVWFKGEIYQEHLALSANNKLEGHCESGRTDCWGHLAKRYNAPWWVKVKSAEGWVGWTDQTEHFAHIDACGYFPEAPQF